MAPHKTGAISFYKTFTANDKNTYFIHISTATAPTHNGKGKFCPIGINAQKYG